MNMRYNIDHKVIFPDALENDMALILIRTTKDIFFDHPAPNVDKISLGKEEPVKEGSEVTVCGFGQTEVSKSVLLCN